jgi:MFS family permease
LLIPVSLLLFGAFLLWERRYGNRGRQPVIALDLFRLRSYTLGSALALLYFAGFTSIFFIFTLYLQNGLGYSALMAGLAITPFALGSAAGAALGGRLVTRMGRPLIAVGLALVALGFLGTIVAVGLEPGRPVAWATLAPLLIAGVGSGFSISPNQAITLSQVPPQGGGSAAGVLQTGQRVGSAIGIAAVGAVFFATLAGRQGDWSGAFRMGLAVTTVFVVAALVLALVDVVAGRGKPHLRRHRHTSEHRWSAAH